MANQNYVLILQQLLEKLQNKLKKEQLILEQIKAINNPLQLLNQEQRIHLLRIKISSTTDYSEQLNQRIQNERV